MMFFKRIAKALLRRGGAFINARPGLKKYIMTMAWKLGLYDAARTLYARVKIATDRSRTGSRVIPSDIAHLTPYARKIYFRLNAAIECRQKEID